MDMLAILSCIFITNINFNLEPQMVYYWAIPQLLKDTFS